MEPQIRQEHRPTDDHRCTAMSKQTKERCQAWAIKGTRVCRRHGGRSPRGAGTGRPVLHGAYSKYSLHLTEAIEIIEGMNQPELADEIALTRALLIRLQSEFGPDHPMLLSGEVLGAFVLLLDQIRKLADSMKKPKPELGPITVRLEETGLPEDIAKLIIEEAGVDCAARIAKRFAAECHGDLRV